MATYFDRSYVVPQRGNRVQDWCNLVLAVWLFISPWVLQFGSGMQATGGAVGMVSTAAWNAWVMAVLVFLVALSAVSRMEMWQEWLNLLFGAWIFVAPWALGFTALAAASWDHWIVGALVFLIALWSMSTARSTVAADSTVPPATRTPRDPL